MRGLDVYPSKNKVLIQSRPSRCNHVLLLLLLLRLA
jgi:hypothetical protein